MYRRNAYVATILIAIIVVSGALMWYYAPYVYYNRPGPTPPPTQGNVTDIVYTLQGIGYFKTFLSLLQEANLTTTLHSPGPFTVFAPTDAAFAALPSGTLASLRANKGKLIDLLEYHIVSGEFTASELDNPAIKNIGSLQGANITIQGTRVDGADVLIWDKLCTNGVMHTLDAVMSVPTRLLTLNPTGLRDISPSTYELWGVIQGQYRSFGKFNIDAQGKMHTAHSGEAVDNTFHTSSDFQDATSFAVSIEGAGEASDTTPSGVFVLTGAKNGTSFSLSFPVDFTSARGMYVLETPTNTSSVMTTSGLWFMQLPGPAPGLVLPNLPSNWIYHGWVMVDSKYPVTTGRFRTPNGQDDWRTYSSPVASAPPYPGEDFLVGISVARAQLEEMGFTISEASGLTFPPNLTDGTTTVAITVEPYVGGLNPVGVGPFFIQPLGSTIPSGAKPGTVYQMALNTASVPTASATLSTH